MKEHLIRTWCDVCLGEDGTGRAEGSTHTVAVDGNKAEIDLCPDHESALLGPLLALAGVRGVPVKAIAPPAHSNGSRTYRTAACPICDLEMTASGLANHVWHVHVGRERPGYPDSTCPDCGRKFPDARSIGAHRSQTHGYVALDEAVDAYRTQVMRS